MRKLKKIASDDSFCFADKTIRTIYLSGEVNLKMAAKFRRLFRAMEQSEGDITVEISTPGGEEYAGFMIMDTIMLSDRNVITRATGLTMSMGALILIAGDTREATPLTSLMVHQGHIRLVTRMEELLNEKAELDRWESKAWDILDDRTGHNRGYWKEYCRGINKYLNAEEALKDGLIHRICGESK